MMNTGNKKLFILFTTILSLFFVYPVYAQKSNIVFKHYDVHNGLINNTIECLYTDTEGFVWFGSANGLQVFDGYSFRSYSCNPDDTLSISDIFVSSISEDKYGNMWIGTAMSGLEQFDKQSEIFFHYRQGNKVSDLTGNSIPLGQQSIVSDSEGFVWVNTENGLNKIDCRERKVKKYYGDFSGSVIYDRADNALWIFYDRLKKFSLKTSKLEYFQIDSQTESNERLINSGALDNKGLIWLGTKNGIRIFNKTSNKVYSISEYFPQNTVRQKDYYLWENRPVRAIYIDYVGDIWLSIQNKIYIINGSNGTYEVLCHESDEKNSPLNAIITGIYGTDAGVIWITYLNKGVSKININIKKFFHFNHISNKNNTFSGEVTRSVYKDKHHTLWIGTYNSGLSRIDSPSGQISYYCHNPKDPSSINSDYITAIYVDSRQRLWVGTFENGFCYADNIYKSSNLTFKRFLAKGRLEIHEFDEDPFGRIWIATQQGLYVYNPKDDKFSYYGDLKNQIAAIRNLNIQSLSIDPKGEFWLATWNRGVCRFIVNSDSLFSSQIKQDRIEIFDTIKDVDRLLIDKGFITIYKDKSGVYWLGSHISGLIKMTIINNKPRFKRYDKSKGAPDNSVYGIAEDKSGNLWISTNYGLAWFNPNTESFKNFYESDGLQSNSFLWDAAYQDEDGQIFFGGINGLNAFYPDSIKDNKKIPTIHISSLKINNKEVLVREKINGRILLEKNIRFIKELVLNYRESAFSLEFNAIDDVNQDAVQYLYKLEGFDKEWIKTNSEKRSVSYTNLDEGTYYFKVKASNSDGIWNDSPAILKIVILPPWWRSWWANMLYIILFGLFLMTSRKLALMRSRLKHEILIEQLERNREKDINQAKLKFFTNISHEFRTPLTLILGPLEKIISLNRGDEMMNRYFSMIQKNADRLYRLIEQVMDFRKLDLGLIELNASEGDIYTYVKDIVSSFEENALLKKIDLVVEIHGKPVNIWFDKDKLEKIILNLMSNAFKFTPENGKISVSVSFIDNQDTIHFKKRTRKNKIVNKYVEISVKDNGIGIPHDKLSFVFDRFYKADNVDFTAQSGTGIGLSLTKDFVELHKGEIYVWSKAGEGTCFSIRFPYGTKHLEKKQISPLVCDSQQIPSQLFVGQNYDTYKIDEASPESPNLTAPTILIVEDDTELLNFIRESLSSSYQFIEASNGISGLKNAIEANPDLIISDVMMPGMDGIEMAAKIKSNLKTSHIPIIFLTAKTSVEFQIKGFDTGADAYIAKPFTIKLLEVQIKNLIETRRKLREQFSQRILLQPKDITITSIDEKFIKKAMLLVENNMENPDLSVEDLCREIGISRSQLHRKLKALTSYSSTEFIRVMRLKRAAQLLIQGRITIDLVADKVGFNSPSYFTKCFRLHFGESPKDYIGSHSFSSEKSLLD